MKKILFFLVLFFSSFYSKAGHHVGGYISVSWISGYTYRITINDYVNSCDTDNVDNARLSLGDGIYDPISFTDATGDSVCACRKVTHVSLIHTYPGPGNYYIWVNLQSRVPNICNMAASVNTDMFLFYSLTIPPSGNNLTLPEITNPPACGYACPSNCFYYNPNVSIPAGDSVAYSLGNCLILSGSVPGYFIPPGATINPVTGEFSWCKPASDCLWNFAILITTYNSHKIAIDTQEVEMEVNVQSDCALGVNKIIAKSEEVTIYPNPSNGAFTLRVESEKVKVESVTVEIYNVLGEKVSQFTIHNSQFSIDLSSQPNGIYFYRVISENGNLVGEGKLIIQK